MQSMKKYLEDKLIKKLNKDVRLVDFPNLDDLVFEIINIKRVMIVEEEEFKYYTQKRNITLFTQKNNIISRHETYDIFKNLTNASIEYGEFTFYQGKRTNTRETIFDKEEIQMIIAREINKKTEFVEKKEDKKLNYEEDEKVKLVVYIPKKYIMEVSLMDTKTQGRLRLTNVLEKVIEQKVDYSRLITQSINFELPKEIYDLVLKKIRPNMKITFIQDPWDLYNILKLKDTITFVKTPVFKEYIETEVFDSNVQMLTDVEFVPGEYVRDYSKVVLDYPPQLDIGNPQVFSIDRSKTYRKCKANSDNILIKDEEKIVEDETRLYVYVPDITKFKEYYAKVERTERAKRKALNLEFLSNIKKLYLYKNAVQKSLLSLDQTLPYELIEDVVKLSWDLDCNVKLLEIVTKENLEKIFVDFFTQEPIAQVNAKNKNSTIVKYDSSNILLKDAKETPALITLQGNDIERVFDSKYSVDKPFVFKQYLSIEEILTDPETNEMTTRSTFKIYIYIYNPSKESIREYKRRKLAERKKMI